MSSSNIMAGIASQLKINDTGRAKLKDQLLKEVDQPKGLEFKSLLEGKASEGISNELTGVQQKPLPATLKFSNHAVDRMSQRGISFTAGEMIKIEQAARKAAEKGSKETLVFAGDAALIVSLKNNTVVTVMDKDSLKENVFTNIDSTVMI